MEEKVSNFGEQRTNGISQVVRENFGLEEGGVKYGENNDVAEDEAVWAHAAEAAAIVIERRKDKRHKYHRKVKEVVEEASGEVGESGGVKEAIGEVGASGGVDECIVVLLGLPATGKSSLCRELKER